MRCYRFGLGALVAGTLAAGYGSSASAAGLAVSACTGGRTFYIATTGNDANAGTISLPWAHVDKIENAGLKPCDTVYVRGGVYHETHVVLGASGSAGKPISILAYPGESPVLDATGLTTSSVNNPVTVTGWTMFFSVKGQYIQLAGFEVRNGGMGVTISGSNDTVANMLVHDVQQHGITSSAANNLIEFNTVYNASLNQKAHPATVSQGGWAYGLGATGPGNGQTVNNNVFYSNTIYNVWGEGLNTMWVTGAYVDSNVVYDNWAQNIYVNNATSAIVKNNIAYNTPNNAVGARAPGITLADEVSTVPLSANNAIINNMLMNADIYAFYWTLVPNSGLNNVLVSNNTVVNGGIYTGGKQNSNKAASFMNVVNTGGTFQNNIVYRNDGGPVAQVSTPAGLTFTHHAWSAPPPPPAASSADLVGQVQVSAPAAITPGKVTPANFAAANASVLAGAGVPVSMSTPFWTVTSQGSTLNLGAAIPNPQLVYH